MRRLAWCLSLGLVGTMAIADRCAIADEVVPESTPAAPGQLGITSRHSFQQLGVDYQMTMHGPEAELGVPFGVRVDQLPLDGSIQLAYQVADHVPHGHTELLVRLNGVSVDRIELHAADAGKRFNRHIVLDAKALIDFNHLEFVLHSDAGDLCVPGKPAAWIVRIDNGSSVELRSRTLGLSNDLSHWPLPFFDRRDIDSLRLTMVLGQHPGLPTLQAAGLLASWFGALASYRGVDVQASADTLPSHGNAIALITSEHPINGISTPAITGPQVEMENLPGDDGHKLLLVMGRDDAELRTAVLGLLQGTSMQGDQVHFPAMSEPAPRQPYDAPGWLSTRGPVTLGELGGSTRFTVQGPIPDTVSLQFMLPPDLFTTGAQDVPLHLHYRATAAPIGSGWGAQVNLNHAGVDGWKLDEATDPTSMFARWHALPDEDQMLVGQRTIRLPLSALSARNQLQVHFSFGAQPGCISRASRNAMATVDPGSTLDISHLQHYLVMPDLAAFANSGFPFSRYADLEQTTLVLPGNRDEQDNRMLLNLLAMLGSRTGYPAYRVHLSEAADAAAHAGDDLIVLGRAGTQPLLSRWSTDLPANTDPAGWRDRVKRWLIIHVPGPLLHLRRPDLQSTAQAVFDARQYDVMVQGFRSPLDHRRSVIAIQYDGSRASTAFYEAMQRRDELAHFQGSVATVQGDRVRSYAGLQSYTIGHLSWMTRLQLSLSARPWLLVAVAFCGIWLSAWLGRGWLRRRAAWRLKREYLDD